MVSLSSGGILGDVECTLGGCTLGGAAGGSGVSTCCVASTLFLYSSAVPLNTFVTCFSVSNPLWTRDGGTFPHNASVSCFVAWMIASAGVTHGLVMYLCLDLTVSEPFIPRILGNHP